MGDVGVIVLVVMAIAIVAAWINYAVASPERKRRIEAARQTRSDAIVAKAPGSARKAAPPSQPGGVSEDSTYGS